MGSILTTMNDLMNLVLGSPDTSLEKWVIVAAAFFGMTIIGSLVGNLFGLHNSTMVYAGFVTLVGLALMLVAASVVQVQVPVTAVGVSGKMWAMVGAAVAVSLVIVVPLISYLLKGGYIAGLMTWLISLGAAVAMVLLVGQGFKTFASAGRDAERTGSHKADLETIMKQ